MRSIKKKGFTLIELIAAIAIFSIVLSAVYTALESGNAIYFSGLRKDNVQTSVRQASAVLSQAIKNSRVAIIADSNPRFNSIELGTGEKKLLYVEGNDNKRYLYIIRIVNGIKELHRLKFSDAFSDSGFQKYGISSPIYEQRITEADKTLYNSVTNSHNKLPLSINNMSSRLEIDPALDFNNSYSVVDPVNNFYYILYENYGDRGYLWAKKISDGLDYKIRLHPMENTDYYIESEEKITGYIDDINVYADVPITDQAVSVTNQNIYKLNIYVKTKDKDKTKEINTSSFILNYRGGI
jgi:prepilin-type N-terminal cleavage/methylation domain-containing protein